MAFQHKNLTAEKWESLSFFEQMANIGADVGRAINWRKENSQESKLAFYRALELLWLTINWSQKYDQPKLKELIRLYEILGDYFAGQNRYKTNDKFLNDYFYAYGYAHSLERYQLKSYTPGV